MRRALLVVLVLAVIPPGLRADEKAAEAAIQKMGGRVVRDSKKPGMPVVRVTLTGPKANDAAMKEVKNFPQLTYLHLGNARVTDEGLKEIKSLSELTTLNLNVTPVTDAGMKELKDLKKLT